MLGPFQEMMGKSRSFSKFTIKYINFKAKKPSPKASVEP